MEVKTVVETPDGALEYTANLNSEETKFILEVGLNFLLQQGAVPFTVIKKEDEMNIMEESGTAH